MDANKWYHDAKIRINHYILYIFLISFIAWFLHVKLFFCLYVLFILIFFFPPKTLWHHYTIVPSAAPQAVSGMPYKDSRSIKVTWKPPPKDQQNGEIQGYKIFYVKNEKSQTDQDAKSVSVEAEEIVLGELEIFTEYKIWVIAFTTVGDGPRSQPIRVWTNEDGRYTASPILSKSSPCIDLILWIMDDSVVNFFFLFPQCYVTCFGFRQIDRLLFEP